MSATVEAAATVETATASAPVGEQDQRVRLHDVSWEQYDAILAIRGEWSGVRITYLDGELELMSPSIGHEGIKTCMGRLLELYAVERGLALNGYGSWTLRSRPRARGVEPDECYVLGNDTPTCPDLALEVVWTSGGLDKLEVYRGLGVREVWFWRDHVIEVHALRGEQYEPLATSELLPEIDLARLAELASERDQTAAVRTFQAELRATAPSGS